jgi:hypothetical protein
MADDDKTLDGFRRRSDRALKESEIPDEQSGQLGAGDDLQRRTQGIRTPFGRVEVVNELRRRRRLFDLAATLDDDYEAQ